MLIPLFSMLIAYTALFGWLVLVGVRADIAEQKRVVAQRRAPSRPIASPDVGEGAA